MSTPLEWRESAGVVTAERTIAGYGRVVFTAEEGKGWVCILTVMHAEPSGHDTERLRPERRPDLSEAKRLCQQVIDTLEESVWIP